MNLAGLAAGLIKTVVRGIITPHTIPRELLENASFLAHSQHVAYSNSLSDIVQHKTVMLDLPVEILERVASFVGPQEVIALRSTSKKLEEATNSSFIHHFVRCRRHAISDRSLRALCEISAHPYFARFVEKVILDTTYPFKQVKGKYLDGAGQPFTYWIFCTTLSSALSRLSVHGTPIVLGVTDRNPLSFGIRELLSRPESHLFKQERIKIFSILCGLAENKRVDLKISGWDLELKEDHGPHQMSTRARIFASTCGGLASKEPTLRSLSIRLNMPPDTRGKSRLIWEPKGRSLQVVGINKWQGRGSMTSGLFESMTWPLAAKIRDLTLSDCILDDGDFFQFADLIRTCLKTLEKIKLSRIIIKNNSRWSLVLQQLARAPNLKEFTLELLTLEVNTRANLVARSATIVHIVDWCDSGDQISAELDNIAAIVRADEQTWESIDNEDSSKWAYHFFARIKQLHKNSKPRLTSANDESEEIPSIPGVDD
jgi:hypothetical protein